MGDTDARRRRILVFYNLGGGGDWREIEGAEYHAGETYNDCDNDSEGDYAACQGFVLKLRIVTKHLAGVEKVSLKNKLSESFEYFHRKILLIK